MRLQQQIATELIRRADLLPREMKDWKLQTDQNKDGMGIHQSQIAVANKLFEGLLLKQEAVVGDFKDPVKLAAMTQQEFTEKRLRLEQALTGAHSIMGTFRYIFAQRDPSQPFKSALDAADLVAAYCYLPCMRLANEWRGLPKDHFREPPLIFLNANLSPTAMARHRKFGMIGLELHGEVDLQLPIPIISLSFHDSVASWSLCSLYHEVGHVLDQDLGLRGPLGDALVMRLGASQNSGRWKQWIGEMVADTFGVLLGGAGFAHSLMNMLYKTEEEVLDSGAGAHPNSYVRVFLICSLLRGTGVAELSAAADTMSNEWRQLYAQYEQKKNWDSYLTECETVADTLLNEKVLTHHCLRDFAPTLEEDHKNVLKLARYLRRGINPPDRDELFIRLAPAAAQMATQAVTAEHAAKYDEIHSRALDFIEAIDHPQFLSGAGFSGEHDKFLDAMINNLDLSGLSPDLQ